MKNIFRTLLVLFLPLLLLLNSCKNESFDNNWTSSPSFTLYNTTLSSNVLYPTLATNSFRLAWDNTANASSSYTVQMSSTADFASPVTFATATTNSYTTTIGALNTALLQAGFPPYTSKIVYFRVVSGTSTSNAISLAVSPYPTSVPVITAPASGTVLVLDRNQANNTATTITWTDYSTYGVTVNYLVEVAPKGTSNFTTLGSVADLKTLAVTHKAFNDAVLKVGLVANVAADVDIRVTATTASAGGTISKVSNVVTIKVTPYIAFKNLYLVGDATAAGWNPNNSNQAIFRDPATPTQFHYVGYFGTSMFKLIEVLGQWQPQWGTNSAGTIDVNDGTGSDPGTFMVPSSGYYKFTMDMVTKTYTFAAYDATSAPFYGQVSLIGAFNGWNADLDMNQSSFDPHLWYATNVTLPTGELKFRAEHSWTTNWGPTTALQAVSILSGIGVQGGENVKADAGTYNIYFDDIDGSYLFVKQ